LIPAAIVHPQWAVLLELTVDYFIMAFAAVLGMLQASSAYAGRSKMCFFNRPLHAYIFAVLTTGPAMLGFFTWNWRHATGLIEGSQQFIYFSLACACAVGLSLLLSWSVRHAGLQVPHYRLIKRLPRTVGVRDKGA
jgi:hypothetical protein